MASEGGIHISFKIETADVVGELKAFRHDFKIAKIAMQRKAGEREVLPFARTIAPRLLIPSMIVGSNLKGAYLTTNARGWKRARFAYLNFGGHIKTPLRPVRAKALRFNGLDEFGNRQMMYRAAVNTPRYFKGKRFMERAVNYRVQAYADDFARQIDGYLRRRLGEV